MPEKVNRVRAILAQHGINIKNLCSTDSELQAPEVEKLVLYLKKTGLTNEQVEEYLTNLKVELLNLIDENSK